MIATCQIHSLSSIAGKQITHFTDLHHFSEPVYLFLEEFPIGLRRTKMDENARNSELET